MRQSWDPTIPAVMASAAMLAGALAFTGGLGPDEWRADLRGANSVRLEVRVVRTFGDSRFSTDVDRSELTGLDAEAFGRSGAPLRFAWKRDPGTLRFEGEGGRKPRGKVRFEGDPAFVDQWQALGFRALDDDDLLRMAMYGARLADAAKLHELGYRDLAASDLMRLDPSPETMEWVEAMRALDPDGDFAELLRLRSNGVGVQEARDVAALGLKEIRAEEFIRLRNHGIGPDYLKGLINARFEMDDIDGIVRLASHGVDPAYVAGIRTSGLPETRVDDVVRIHQHGIDSDYARDVVSAGLADASTDTLVRLHAHGVPAEYVKASIVSLPRAGRTDAIVMLHDHGLREDWIVGMAAHGFRDARAEDLTRMHAHGVTPEELVRDLADAGYRDLTVNAVIRAATQGPDSLGPPSTSHRRSGDTVVQ